MIFVCAIINIESVGGFSMDPNIHFGERIKQIRKSKNMTIRAVGERADVSHSYISQIENGRRDIPNPDMIKKLAIGLGEDYFSLMRFAGYLDSPNNDMEFLLKVVNSAPAEFQKEFMTEHSEHIKNLVESKKKLNLNVPKPEIKALFPKTFFNKAKTSDYLKLLRLYQEIDIDKISQLLEIESNIYIDLEKNISYQSEYMKTYGEKLGEILGVGDFNKWMLFVYTETPNEEYIDSYNPNDEMIEITLQVPSVIKSYDENGDVYFQYRTEDQLKENLNKIEHILAEDRMLTYFGRYLSNKDKKKIISMIEILLDD